MKSRIAVVLQKACLLVSATGCVVSIVALPDNSIWRKIFLVVLAGSCGWHVFNTACPHCGRVGGVKPKPFGPNAGKCIYCGKHIDFK